MVNDKRTNLLLTSSCSQSVYRFLQEIFRLFLIKNIADYKITLTVVIGFVNESLKNSGMAKV